MSNFDYLEKKQKDISCSSLWIGVIGQALHDYFSKSESRISEIRRVKALLYFNLDNENFLEVCKLANLDPVVVLKYKKKAEGRIENGEEIRIKLKRVFEPKSSATTRLYQKRWREKKEKRRFDG